MNESEKVSSPSAALPDVRALMDRFWNALVALNPYIGHAARCGYSSSIASSPDSDFCTCALADRKKAAREALNDLSAALRSREGERADPADFATWFRARMADENGEPYGHPLTLCNRECDYFGCSSMKEAYEAGAAAQRATPSAPTPADE